MRDVYKLFLRITHDTSHLFDDDESGNPFEVDKEVRVIARR